MKEWSVNCLGLKKPKVFLDTNILSYLVDQTYPTLNDLLLTLKETCLFDLISSDYCKNEFVGIRKREHYLRLSVQKAQDKGKSLNFSSLLKYHNQFSSVEVQFESIIGQIKSNVNDELQKITTDFGINFCCSLHSGLTSLANNICLCSKISKEDSLVLVSSVMPQDSVNYDNVILLTHDKDFVDWFNIEQARNAIEQAFEESSVPIPNLLDTRKVFGIDLDHEQDINTVVNKFVEWFLGQFNADYVGQTVAPVNGCPVDSFALRAEINREIYQNKYLFIIGRDLDYMYAVPNPIDFFHRGKSIDDRTTFTTSAENMLCARVPYNEDYFESIKLHGEIISALREDGNYVFYLPIQE